MDAALSHSPHDDAPRSYVHACPRCSRSAFDPGRCARCGVDRVAVAAHRAPAPDDAGFEVATGALFVASLAAFATASPRVASAVPLGLALYALSRVVVSLASRVARRWSARAALRGLDVALASTVSLRVADVAGDGERVRIAGVVRAGVDAQCVARSLRNPLPGTGAVALAQGEVFEVDDGSGVIARVRAGACVLVGARRAIRDGDRVEVVGRAHAVVARDGVAGAAMRGAARAVEIRGTADEPAVLRAAQGASVRDGVELGFELATGAAFVAALVLFTALAPRAAAAFPLGPLLYVLARAAMKLVAWGGRRLRTAPKQREPGACEQRVRVALDDAAHGGVAAYEERASGDAAGDRALRAAGIQRAR